MRAVIFDFDGTIADSFPVVIAIAYHLTKKPELANYHDLEYMKTNNPGLMQLLKKLNIPKWQWPWLLLEGRKMMTKEMHLITIFPGIEELLKELKKQSYKLYIITSNSKANVEQFLILKGILPYFDNVYGGASLFDKAKLIKKVIKAESIEPSSAVYVGDEVRDIVAAKQVNMPCIAVTWGYNTEDLLMQYSPMVVARTPKQLENILVEWGNTI